VPSQRTVSVLAVVAGLALIANGVAFHAFDVGGERYRYDTLELTASAEYFRVGSDSTVDAVPDRITGIDCVYDGTNERLCALELHLVETAGGDAGDPESVSVELASGFDPPGDVPQYALIEGQVYERRFDAFDASDSTVTVGLEPVDTDDAIADVAVPPSELSPTARRVVDSGPTTTNRALAAHGQVVDTADGYVVIVGDDDPVRGERPLRRGAAAFGQLIAGLLLVRRGCRPSGTG
jgi:hypothetical protein